MKELKLESPEPEIKFKFRIGRVDKERPSVEIFDGPALFLFVIRQDGKVDCPFKPYPLTDEKYTAMYGQAAAILEQIKENRGQSGDAKPENMEIEF